MENWGVAELRALFGGSADVAALLIWLQTHDKEADA